MSTADTVQNSGNLFSMQDTEHEDWIVTRAMEIVERRVFLGGPPLQSPTAVKDFLRIKLAGQPNEVFAVLFLDSQFRVIAYDELFKGTVNQTSVYPRVVLSEAMKHNASAIVFAHNHPSGLTEPSNNDKVITSKLKTILNEVDVRVLDHIVVGQGEPYSFAEKGLL